MKSRTLLAGAGLLALAFLCPSSEVQAGGKSGTTLAASKTLDICAVDVFTWRYSGVISVWNEGAVDTQGLGIHDDLQNKPLGATQWGNFYPFDVPNPGVIPKYTPTELATTYPYSYDLPSEDGDIRNVASITILNHSGSIGTAKGPQPKATWLGGTPPACAPALGCTLTRGYWHVKPDVTWPAHYNRTDPFYLSGTTWDGIFEVQPHGNQYYILAVQYIAAKLNEANGAYVPTGIKDILGQSDNFFVNTLPSACGPGGSCGLDATWAGILDVYNNGHYPEGPPHCP